MTAMEYLSQGRRLNEMIAYHTERLREMRACADGIGAVRMREVRVQQSPGEEPPYVRALHRVWAMQETIDRELQQVILLDRQMSRTIDGLVSGDYRMLLRYRYMKGKTWEQIADLMHIDPSTARRWHRKAMDMLTVPEDAICIRDALPPPGAEEAETAGENGGEDRNKGWTISFPA